MEKAQDGEGSEIVPVFGSWPRIYAAVVVVNVTWIAASYFFSRFPF